MCEATLHHPMSVLLSVSSKARDCDAPAPSEEQHCASAIHKMPILSSQTGISYRRNVEAAYLVSMVSTHGEGATVSLISTWMEPITGGKVRPRPPKLAGQRAVATNPMAASSHGLWRAQEAAPRAVTTDIAGSHSIHIPVRVSRAWNAQVSQCICHVGLSRNWGGIANGLSRQ